MTVADLTTQQREIVIGALKELREEVLAELPCTCLEAYTRRFLNDPSCFRHPVEQVLDQYIKHMGKESY